MSTIIIITTLQDETCWNSFLSSSLLQEAAEFMLQPKGKYEAWRKPSLSLAMNVGDNHEEGGYVKALAERDLEWQARKQSLFDFFLRFAKQDFLYA